MKKNLYLIINTITGRRYIGRSLDVERRYNQHIRGLRGGYHHNNLMQIDFDLYGETSFNIDIIGYGDSKDEADLIKKIGDYNVIGKPVSESTKIKMSNARIGKTSVRKGIKNSIEHNEKISRSLVGNQRARKNNNTYEQD